jgi:signal transduction histidine kinase
VETILIIEDSESLREEISAVLGFEGFRVLTAENGRLGVEAAKRERPDLVVCDIMMPELDGYGTLAAVRADPDLATLPFVCLTARSERIDMRRAMELGADDFLNKPFAAEELIAAVRAGLEKKARAATATEERLAALRAGLSTALPHEFRTPLAVILGYAELLQDPSVHECRDEVRKLAGRIGDAAKRLNRLTENLLLSAQQDLQLRNGPADEPQVGTPTPLAEVAFAVAREKAAAIGRLADLHLAGAPVAVGVERQHLTRLVEELVDNALKFSPGGSPIVIETGAEGDGAVLTVTDQGSGMSPEQVASVAPYIQFERVVREQQGLGLGLAIARQIAKLAGGALTLESTPGVGTKVTVRLPRAPEVGA